MIINALVQVALELYRATSDLDLVKLDMVKLAPVLAKWAWDLAKWARDVVNWARVNFSRVNGPMTIDLVYRALAKADLVNWAFLLLLAEQFTLGAHPVTRQLVLMTPNMDLHSLAQVQHLAMGLLLDVQHSTVEVTEFGRTMKIDLAMDQAMFQAACTRITLTTQHIVSLIDQFISTLV